MTKTRRPPTRSSGRRVLPARRSAAARAAGAPPSADRPIDDAFFRHIVAGMRNGVLAITRDGKLALINDEAYRIFACEPRDGDLGAPVADVLRDHPDVVRVLMSSFELNLLPNRV